MELIKKNVLNKKNIKVQLDEHIIWLIISYACDRNPIFNTIPRCRVTYLSFPRITTCSHCNLPMFITIKLSDKILYYPIETTFATTMDRVLMCVDSPEYYHETLEWNWDDSTKQYIL